MIKDDYYYAKKRVKAKKGFYHHFSVYLAAGLFFFLMNLATWDEEPELWFFFPLIPWGMGLLIHYFAVFGLPGIGALTKEWEEKEIEKEMAKLRGMSYTAPLKEDFESLELESNKFEAPASEDSVNKYDDKDLV